MFKNGKSKNIQRENELKFLNFIQPIIEIIVKDIINSRIKNNKEKDNLLIHYKTNNNKYIDLTQIQDNNLPNIFELNIYVLYKKQNISFIVEHWRFKIDSTQSQKNGIKNELRIKKKLLTFFRSIKCMEKILPLNSLINNSFNISFQVQLYQQSSIEIYPEKNEKKQINLEVKDDNFGNIKLCISYYTMDGIISHEDNIKKNINYFDYYNNFYSKLSTIKTGQSKLQKLPENDDKPNKDEIIEKKYIDEDNKLDNDNNLDDSENLSAMFEKQELIFSTLIESKILDQKGQLGKSDLEEIKEVKKGNSKEIINLDELYSSCFKNIDDINFKNNLDEILDKNVLMSKEKKKLDDIKSKYDSYFVKNDLMYEKIKGYEFNDLLINHPKKDGNKKNIFIIDNYCNDDKKEIALNNSIKKEELFKDIITDFIEIKQLLNS